MSVGEERDEQALDDGILADDGAADFFTQFLRPYGTGDHDWKKSVDGWSRFDSGGRE